MIYVSTKEQREKNLYRFQSPVEIKVSKYHQGQGSTPIVSKKLEDEVIITLPQQVQDLIEALIPVAESGDQIVIEVSLADNKYITKKYNGLEGGTGVHVRDED